MKIHQLFIIFSFTLFLLSSTCFSQVSFQKIDNYISSEDLTFNTMISIDLNQDLIEDIIHFDNGNRVIVNLNNRLGRDWKRIEGPVVGGNVWGGVAVDLNNDGFTEIICGATFTPIEIYTFNHETSQFILYQTLPSNIFVQNINAVDINKDGFSDVFICNDLGENHFYMSNEGVLEEFDLIDFSTPIESDAAGNYASQFIDFDLDGDEDLYITKCSAFADEPDDPRRINQLFVNDGNGNFTENGAAFNINTGAQSWASDFGDLDLDGDLDLIVANHFEDLQLYENINNEEFVEVQATSNLSLQHFFFQVALQDVNNDGYEDIIITENSVEIYLNNGDFTFNKLDLSSSQTNTSSSFTLGDYNNDGQVDINMKNGSFSSTNDTRIVLQNSENSNNWIKFSLEGTTDNINALGTRVRVYANNMIQNKIKRFGRSYGVQFANQLHFGIGNGVIVDSVEIFWLNGDVEKFHNLDINETHYIKQNECNVIAENYTISKDIFCENETAIFEHDSDNFIEWNTNEVEKEIAIDQEGLYFSRYNDVESCTLNAWKAYVEYKEIESATVESIVLDDEGLLPCPEEEIILSVNDSDALWNDDIVSSEFSSTTEGTINVKYSENCIDYDLTLNRVDISFNFESPDDFYEYTSGQDIEIDVTNPFAEWYYDINQDPFYVGNEYVFQNVIDDQEISILNRTQYRYKDSLGIFNFDNAKVPPSNINYSTYFTVNSPLLLESIQVKSVAPGDRAIEILSTTGSLEAYVITSIPEGEFDVELNVILNEGNYIIRTNQNQNQSSFNSNGPLLYQEEDSSNPFPFTDENETISITGGDSEELYYFYNWKVSSLEDKECIDGFYETELKMINSVGEELKEIIKYNSLVSDV